MKNWKISSLFSRQKIDRVVGYTSVFVNLAIGIVLPVIAMVYGIFPEVRNWYRVNYTLPAVMQIKNLDGIQPEGTYLKIEGIFLPRQERRMVEKPVNEESVRWEKDKAYYYLLCEKDRSSCIYYSPDDLSWKPYYGRSVSVTGIVKNFNEDSRRRMTFLEISERGEFDRKYPVRIIKNQDGSLNWNAILANQIVKESDTDQPLKAPSDWYLKEDTSYKAKDMLALWIILSLFSIFWMFLWCESAISDYRELRQEKLNFV